MGIMKKVLDMAGGFLAIFKTRLELVSVELQEEVQRILSYLVLSLLALFCAVMALSLATFLIIVLCWDSYRILSICCLIVFFALMALVMGLNVRASFRKKPKLFAYTRAEIAKDLERMRPVGGQEDGQQ